jgi:SAM-dependent methyltransferase
MLNLGCGARLHASWINVDLTPTSPGVVAHDLSRPLPFPDDYFEAVYLSHVLEHFDPVRGRSLLQECFRVCAPRGIIRVVVPDLEEIVRLYRKYLDGALQGDRHAVNCYDWMLLELYDQAVRSKSGGKSAEFLRQASPEITTFLLGRVGSEQFRSLRDSETAPASAVNRVVRLLRKPNRAWYHLRALLTRGLMRIVWGKPGAGMANEALFRQTGEVHRSMYDRFSLPRVLMQVGFTAAVVTSAYDSRIAHWDMYGLDLNRDGTVYKPDSLMCEGVKP